MTPPFTLLPRRFALLGHWALVLWLVLALGLYAFIVNPHYPIANWLAWRYAAIWIYCGVWTLGCVSLGHRVLAWVLRHPLGLLEHITIAFTVGMFGFELLMFGCAALGWLSSPLFFVAPLLAVATGAVPLWRFARRTRRHIRAARRRAAPLPAWAMAPIGLGLLALGLIYFALLTPENVQFDARWRHMALAEDYVASGGLRRFPELAQFVARPHLTSFLYAWAFLAPGTQLFDRMVLGAHVEFVVFLVTTLFGISAVVRRLAPGADARLVWAARFLFPGVFLYDSSLSGGADHIGAAFAPAILLLLLYSWRRLEPRTVALLAVCLAGAVMVKDTVALMFAGVPVLAIAVRSVQFGIRQRWGALAPELRGRWFVAPALATLVGLVLTTPYWLRNFIEYGDPFFPMLSAWLRPAGILPDTLYRFEWGYKRYQLWAPPHDWSGVLETLRALVTWPFEPHNYSARHGNRPVVGALFTLLLPSLLFLRGTLRIGLTVVWIHIQLFIWYWIHHQDRYLQALMPLIAAVVAAVIVKVWQTQRWPLRAALLALVGLQVLDGADVYFIPTHAMMRAAPATKTVELLGAQFRKKYEQRLTVQSQQVALGAATPQEALIVIHEEHNVLGYGRRLLHDFPTWQYGLSYGDFRSPRALWEDLRRMGVTHLVWKPKRSRGFDTLAGDLMFFYFAQHWAEPVAQEGQQQLAALPEAAPAEDDEAFDPSVAVFGCRGGYATGLYELRDLKTPVFGPRSSDLPEPREVLDDDDELMSRAHFVVADQRCQQEQRHTLSRSFELLAKRSRLKSIPAYDLWVRRPAHRP